MAWWWALGCGGPAPVAPPPPVAPTPVAAPPPERAPELALAPPSREAVSPAAVSSDRVLDAVREQLLAVARHHAQDPTNPWAIVHGMLALGAEEKLTNGEDSVDWLFSHYAEVHDVGGEPLLSFPEAKGGVRIEPHTDLVLKALTEGGVPPGRKVHVADGREFPIAALYRASLHQAWVSGETNGFRGSWDDSPWALQGLAAWAPADLEWTAVGNRRVSMDAFTTQTIDTLVRETKPLAESRANGIVAKKDTRYGIFTYTCGGAHLLMGTSYAVARGFGTEDDRRRVCEQKDLWRYRIDVELQAIDPALSGPLDPGLRMLLLSQRLKFLGHWLEVTHKILAMQVCPPTAEDEAANLRVLSELAVTVDALQKVGAFAMLPTMRTDPRLAQVPRGPEQLYLDLVGDSAHALRGLDLATGRSGVRY